MASQPSFLQQLFGSLKQGLPGLAGNLSNTFNQESIYNRLGAQGVQADQQAKAQQAQLNQQLGFHQDEMAQHQADRNSLSAEQQATLGAQQDLRDQQENYQLAQLFGSGKFREAAPGSQGMATIGGKRLEMIPEDQQSGMFSYTPTDADKTNYPWMAGQNKITMPVREYPAFLGDMAKLQKSNPINAAAYETSLNGQLDSLLDPQDKMKSTYKFMIHDALSPGDGSAPDHKRALSVIDDIRKDKEQLQVAQRTQDLKYSPTAVAGEARLSGAKAGAEDDAHQAQIARALPDEVMERAYQNVKKGVWTADQVSRDLGLSDKYAKMRWLGYVTKKGDSDPDGIPVPLDSPSRQTLQHLEPVLDSLKELKERLKPYANDSTPGTLLASRMGYSMGIGNNDGGLISVGEMDRLRGAAQSLTGLRTALPILEQAQIHTPNFWKDSGKLMNDKLDMMIHYLDHQVQTTYKYGAKSGVVPGAATAAPGAPQRPSLTFTLPPEAK